MPTNATTPAATAAATARRRKYSTISASSIRRASHTRYTAARYAHVVTARTPPSTEVGLTQLDHKGPAMPPVGTRPEAIAPAMAPMQYGTRIEEVANAAPKFRRLEVRVTCSRNAKLEPRRTMPSPAIDSGTNNVSPTDANTSGKLVHNTTSEKISQMWLASHTGAMACWMIARGRRPRGS